MFTVIKEKNNSEILFNLKNSPDYSKHNVVYIFVMKLSMFSNIFYESIFFIQVLFFRLMFLKVKQKMLQYVNLYLYYLICRYNPGTITNNKVLTIKCLKK